MTEPRNMLATASSPYLLQHRDNPVHWRIWGAEALAEAAARDVPILLSIGYAACHWCHVMAHESFEDAETAALMNRHFVSIKVDREERPDIDHIYMSALHAMGEQGGWPLTMVLTPAGEPFWGGTYFPPEPRFGRPSFRQVLRALSQAWTADQTGIAQTVAAMSSALAASAAARPGTPPGPADLDTVCTRLLAGMDWVAGGMGSAPKFPNAPVFRFLWQEAARSQNTQASQAVLLLLRRMSQGGIYDHLGGGYARYATDDRWLIPHFEKMLYDNALILELLALTYSATNDPLLAARTHETIAWMNRDMATEGALAASEDADSEGVEGKFYVWTRSEITAALGDETDFFAGHYHLPETGNWEGHIILERLTDLGDPAQESRLAACRAVLFSRRSQRIRPGRDDKILTDWNALAVSALIKASAAFAEPAWLSEAARLYDAVAAMMGSPDGRVAHASRHGKISAPGLLEDQAAMIRAALALFEATGDPARLTAALRLLAATEQYFSDGAGAFYTAASDAADLPAGPGFRSRNVTDGPTPSGIGMMAEAYARLHHLTGSAAYRAKCEAVLAAYGGQKAALAGSPVLLAAADLLENATCVVITGPGDLSTLHRTVLVAADPAVVVMPAPTTATLATTHPAHGKSSTSPAAFICRGGTCALPVTTPEALQAHLRQIKQN